MCIALLAGFVNVYAADGKNTVLDDETADFMTAFGFVTDGTDFKKVCKRSEAAEIAIRLIGTAVKKPSGFETLFKDVTSEDARFAYIVAAYKSGMMDEVDDGYFRPDDNISFEEACRIFVKTAGYGTTFNETFAMYAKRLGITDGVKTTDALTFADMYKMAYNTLHIPYKATVMNTNGSSYEASANTVLEYYHGAVYKEGIVEANELTNFESEFDTPDRGKITIGKSVYDYSDNDLLGYRVKYYTDEKNEKLLYCAVHKKNKTLTVDAADITEYTGGVLKYEKNGKETRVNVPKNIDIIYNGLAYPLCSDDEFIPKIGAITFVDNNGDGKYELAKVESYRLLIVKKTNTKTNTVYDMYDADIAHAGEDGVFEVFAGAKSKTLDSLKKGDPLLVGEAKSNKFNYITATTNAEKFSGTVKSMSSQKVKIEGKSFELANEVRTDREIATGDTVTAFIYNGKCIAIIAEQGFDNEIAYLFNLGVSQDLEEKMSVKLFTKNEGEVTYPLSDKVQIDGVKPGTAAKVKAALAESALLSDGDQSHTYCQPILFGTNSNGEVNVIDTLKYNADREKGDAFKSDYYGYARFFTYNDTYYDDTLKSLACSLDDDTIMMFAPIENKCDKAFYRFTDKGSLTNFNAWTIRAICLDSSKIADFVIMYEDAKQSVNTYATPVVITNKLTKQNADGDAVSALEVIESGTVKEYTLSDDCITVNFDYDDLDIGDIVRYSKNTLGDLLAIERDIDVDNIKDRLVITKEPNSYGDIGAEVRYAAGTVVDMTDKYVSHVRLFPDERMDEQTGFNNYVMYQYTVYLTYDSAKGTVYSNTAADIKTYKDYGESADKVIAMTQYGNLRLVYTLK